MNDDGPGAGHDARPEEERRRIREKVFGDVLPDTTGDERAGDGEGRGDGETDRSATDRWLLDNVPPHHG